MSKEQTLTHGSKDIKQAIIEESEKFYNLFRDIKSQEKYCIQYPLWGIVGFGSFITAMKIYYKERDDAFNASMITFMATILVMFGGMLYIGICNKYRRKGEEKVALEYEAELLKYNEIEGTDLQPIQIVGKVIDKICLEKESGYQKLDLINNVIENQREQQIISI